MDKNTEEKLWHELHLI